MYLMYLDYFNVALFWWCVAFFNAVLFDVVLSQAALFNVTLFTVALFNVASC